LAQHSSLITDRATTQLNRIGSDLLKHKVATKQSLERSQIPAIGRDPIDVVVGIEFSGVKSDDAATLDIGDYELWPDG